MATPENQGSRATQPIPKYKETDSFPDFIQMFQICCELNKWEQSEWKMRLAPYLSGLPLQLYLAMMKEPTWKDTTYTDVVERISELIMPQTHEILTEQRIQERMQLSFERPTVYLLAKRKLIEELAPEASTAKKLFYIMVGLTKEYLDQVAHDSFKTIDELKDKLIELESKKFLFDTHDQQLLRNAQKRVTEYQARQMAMSSQNVDQPMAQTFSMMAVPQSAYGEYQPQVVNQNVPNNQAQTYAYAQMVTNNSIKQGQQRMENTYNTPHPVQMQAEQKHMPEWTVPNQACAKLEESNRITNMDSQLEELRKQMTNLALAVAAQHPAQKNFNQNGDQLANNNRGRRGNNRGSYRGPYRGPYRGQGRGGRRGRSSYRGRGYNQNSHSQIRNDEHNRPLN